MDSPPACTSARLFFPSKEPTVSTLTALSTYLGGFVARPFGAAIFGHFGDRVPTYAQIGIWGGIALTVLRILQGIGVGGEWGGSVLLSVEWGHRGRRGAGGDRSPRPSRHPRDAGLRPAVGGAGD